MFDDGDDLCPYCKSPMSLDEINYYGQCESCYLEEDEDTEEIEMSLLLEENKQLHTGENNQELSTTDFESPHQTDKYYCLLNGNLYGSGDLKYMHELFYDYVVIMKMYNREEVEFKIVKAHEDLIPDRMGRELI